MLQPTCKDRNAALGPGCCPQGGAPGWASAYVLFPCPSHQPWMSLQENPSMRKSKESEGHWPPWRTRCYFVTRDQQIISAALALIAPNVLGVRRVLLSQGCRPETGSASKTPGTGKDQALQYTAQLQAGRAKAWPLWASGPSLSPVYDPRPFDKEMES